MKKIDPNSVLALELASRNDYIAQLEANIENWKKLQIENCHSASAIRYYAELVEGARKEAASLRSISHPDYDTEPMERWA
jgi:hypothetical protein